MNNEKELLNLYTSKDENRPVLHRPFLLGGYVFATDTYSLIRISRKLCENEYGDRPNGLKPPDVSQIIPKPTMSKQLTTKRLHAALKRAHGESDRRCPECGSDGTVLYEHTDQNGHIHTQVFDCPICKGKGKVPEYVSIRYQFAIHGLFLAYHPIMLLLDTMQLLGVDSLTLRFASPTERALLFGVEDKDIDILIARQTYHEGCTVIIV